MILGPKILLELVKKQKLVENLSSRELKNPEGAGFDLRLGELYKIKGKGFLGETERETPKAVLFKTYIKGKRISVKIKPGDFYLASTIESVNTPENLTINFKPRTTTFRSGLILRTGNAAPGYKGKLTFAIKNEGPCDVILEMGCRIVHAQFEEVKGGGSKYRGQWQHGRVTTKNREVQI